MMLRLSTSLHSSSALLDALLARFDNHTTTLGLTSMSLDLVPTPLRSYRYIGYNRFESKPAERRRSAQWV